MSSESIEHKASALVDKKEKFKEGVIEGVARFSDQEKMIHFSEEITNYLLKQKRKLTEEDRKLLENLLICGFESVTFCLLSDIREGDEKLLHLLERNGFKLFGEVAYIDIA